MAFGKWNTSGELTWAEGDILTAAHLNESIDETTPPIGAVIAWLKSFTGVPATLPSGWVECNGQVLSDADSPLTGQTIPNLNASGGGTQRYLRGATTSGGTGGADSVTLTTTELPAHTHTITSCNNNSAAGTTNGAVEAGGTINDSIPTSSSGSGAAFSILNSYYQVVWIIRVK